MKAMEAMLRIAGRTRLFAGLYAIALGSGCTVIHVVGESGTVETHYLPGIAYIRIDPGKKPLYVHQRSYGIAASNKALSLGFGDFEQVTVEREDASACLLISINSNSNKNDFSFQTQEPDHVCKAPITEIRNSIGEHIAGQPD